MLAPTEASKDTVLARLKAGRSKVANARKLIRVMIDEKS